jgi:hypothetical protein
VEGRNFTEQDNESDKAPFVMIVNQAFVRALLSGRDPIGAKDSWLGKLVPRRRRCQDSKYHYLGDSNAARISTCPSARCYREDMNLAFYVRTKGEPDSVLFTLRAQTHASTPTSQCLTLPRSRSTSAHRSIRKKWLPA